MDDLTNKVEKTIKNHTGLAMGAAIIPLPVIDMVAISAVEWDMLRSINKLYGITWSEDIGKQIIAIAAAATIGTGIWGSILKLIPGIGAVAGGMIQMTLAGTICYALGYAYKTYTEKGGVFDKEEFKKDMINNFKKAKKVVNDLKDDVINGKYKKTK